MKPKDETRYIPMGVAEKKSRLERFAELNRWVTARGGWIVSVPGANLVVVECLPDSSLINELKDCGYEVAVVGGGERIIPDNTVQTFGLTSGGGLGQLLPGSTRAVGLTIVHAGIARTVRLHFQF
ncbi:hypothetical protein ACQR1I_14185 [Bradyrhizobium sp. HKCCYLS2038]|uniref:hypothetical protein n=1 Tax=unclassified Bradyrhizobium TaxID=2631580 RepID=UPI003EB962CF